MYALSAKWPHLRSALVVSIFGVCRRRLRFLRMYRMFIHIVKSIRLRQRVENNPLVCDHTPEKRAFFVFAEGFH